MQRSDASPLLLLQHAKTPVSQYEPSGISKLFLSWNVHWISYSNTIYTIFIPYLFLTCAVFTGYCVHYAPYRFALDDP